MGALLEELSAIGKAAVEAAVAIDSNDKMEQLIGMPYNDAPAGPATNVNIPVATGVVEIEDEAKSLVATNGHNKASDEGHNGPCSNDNPEYHKYTVDCPGAVGLWIMEQEATTTTATTTTAATTVAPSAGGDGDLVASEFETTTTTAATMTTTTTAPPVTSAADPVTTTTTTTTIAAPPVTTDATADATIPATSLTSASTSGPAAVTSNDVAVAIGGKNDENDETDDGEGNAPNNDAVVIVGDVDGDAPSNDAPDVVDGDGNGDGETLGGDSNDVADLVNWVDGETVGDSAAPPVGEAGDDDEDGGDGGTTTDAAMWMMDNTETYPSFYSCSAGAQDELADSDTNEALPFAFDYEIYTSTTVDDVASVLESFELQLAEGVASSLGLVDCPEVALEVAFRSSAGEVGGGWTRNRRSLQKGATPWGGGDRLLNTNDAESSFVGLSTDPVDRLDTELPGCTSSVTLDVPSKCSPIIGAMTAWITTTGARTRHNLRRHLIDENSKAEQESMLRDAVQTYIQENGDAYLDDDLLHVAYVGRRSTSGGLPVADELQDEDGNPTRVIDIDAPTKEGRRMSYGFVALFVAIALLASIIIGGAIMYHRRRRRRDAEEAGGLHLDLERHGAFPALTPESESVNRSRDGYSNAQDTQDALAPSPDDEQEGRYNSLFGLTGAQSDAVMEEGRAPAPSTLAVLGAASAVARQLSYQSPSPSGGSGAQRDVTPVPNNTPESNASSLDATPMTRGSDDLQDATPESNNSLDNIAPMTPTVAVAEESFSSDEEDSSSVVETTEEYDEYGSPVQQGAFPSMDGSPGYDDTMPTSSQEDVGGDDGDDDYDDYESDPSGVMV